MKTIITTLFVSCIIWTSYSQSETQYLLGSDASFGGFGGLKTELSWVSDKPIFGFGGGGGVLLNQSLFIGGYGMSSISESANFKYLNTPVSLDLSQGGLWLGLLLKPQSLVHFGFNSKIGWGTLDFEDATGENVISDDVFLLHPGIQFDVNVLPLMKLSLGGGYRFGLGVDNPILSSVGLNSPTVNFGIYFGWFGE